MASEKPRLRLAGSLYTGSPSDMLPFLIRAFEMFREVLPPGVVARQIQYASGVGDDDYIHFAGIELDCIENIPDGFIVWEIEEDVLSVLQGANGNQEELVWRGQLKWRWLDQSVPGRLCGEFSIVCPDNWIGKEVRQPCDFRIVSTSYVGGPVDDDVRIVEYNHSWPQMYIDMQKQIEELLGPDVALRIEHYGSTSIPGMPAKPIIDILVEIPSMEEARQRAIPLFNLPTNEYWYYNDHMCFIIRDSVTGTRTHHIHMAPAANRLWDGLAFRDCLRDHPVDAARYAALKHDLAKLYKDDREKYTSAKTEFVKEITVKALRETY